MNVEVLIYLLHCIIFQILLIYFIENSEMKRYPSLQHGHEKKWAHKTFNKEDIKTFTIKVVDDPRILNIILYLRLPANTYSINELVAL